MTPTTESFITILKTQHKGCISEMAKANTTTYLHSLEGGCVAIQAILTDMRFDLEDVTPEDRKVLENLEQELRTEQRQHADRAFDRLIEIYKHKLNREAANDVH